MAAFEKGFNLAQGIVGIIEAHKETYLAILAHQHGFKGIYVRVTDFVLLFNLHEVRHQKVPCINFARATTFAIINAENPPITVNGLFSAHLNSTALIKECNGFRQITSITEKKVAKTAKMLGRNAITIIKFKEGVPKAQMQNPNPHVRKVGAVGFVKFGSV